MKISRTPVLALIATVSLAAVPAAQAVPVAGPSAQQVSTAAEPAAVTSEGAGYADTILSKVNELRAQQGLGPVTRYTQLDSVAQGWSEQMVAQQSMSHNPSFADQYPGGWSVASENVATLSGARGVDVGTQLFEQWRNSPGHYANMVAPAANAVGIGVAYDPSTDSWYAAQNFSSYSDPGAAGLTPTAADQSNSSQSTQPGSEAPAAPAPASTDSSSAPAAVPATEAPASESPADSASAATSASPSEAAPVEASTGTPAVVAAGASATPAAGDPSAAATTQPSANAKQTALSLPVTGANAILIGGVVALVAVVVGGVLLGLRRRR
ncbi:CAP domain-containing protein [Actinomyces gerencseriae]|uniref:CAP domain-containing protein n=1 Tax=Actinomyces gerencseriae TaxID=52769 RepID=UPI0028E456D1|nr:CAP domain-containing protein [Actinomyces gerencseriae]